MATYYVRKDGSNSNLGTSDNAGGAWLTIQKAANTIVGGDTVMVRSGVYDEIVSTKFNGTPANPIVFASSGQANLDCFGLFHEYNYISGFKFTLPSQLVYGSIIFTGSNVRAVQNVVTGIHHSAVRCVDTNGVTPPVPDWPTGVYIGYNSISGVDTVSRAVGFIANNSVIEYNTFDYCACDIIDLWGDNNVVRANTITNTQRDIIGLSGGGENHNDFIQTWNAGAGYHARNNLIERNYISGNYLQLYNLEDGNNSTGFSGWCFRNNVWIDNLLNGNPGIVYCSWYNNTFYHSPYTSGSFNPIIYFNQDGFHSTGGIIYNNLFINCGYYDPSEGVNKIGFYTPSGYNGSTFIYDYNMVSVSGTGFALPTTSPVFSEAHGINGGDPRFVLNTETNKDLRLAAGSPCIGSGVNLSSLFTDDFYGNTRVSWDIGAYAYTLGSGISYVLKRLGSHIKFKGLFPA